MQNTLNFAIDINPEMANFYCAMAYPGSPLHLQARNNNWELPDRYAGYSQHSYHTQNLRNDNLSASEILKFRDEAWLKFHTNEKYLNLLERKFGKAAKNNVQDSSKIKLKRKLLENK
jgi:coproporphyrinogen III oxidase-like Fe-S oxidoreductase